MFVRILMNKVINKIMKKIHEKNWFYPFNTMVDLHHKLPKKKIKTGTIKIMLLGVFLLVLGMITLGIFYGYGLDDHEQIGHNNTLIIEELRTTDSNLYAAPYDPKAQEVPFFVDLVKAGVLPAMKDRLPLAPMVLNNKALGRSQGVYGGSLKTLIGKEKDIKLVNVYGYARLVRYNPSYDIESDILLSFDNKENKEFTFRLRPGHRWSDGHPLTAEDFRYYWEDVANNAEITPSGVPVEMLVEGEAPTFEVVDHYTIRYRWSKPNPGFLHALAKARPLYLYRPAHYLKQFHIQYNDKGKIEKLVEQHGARGWANLHNKKGRMYRANNPELPTLQPWVNKVAPPSDRFIMERNPYFHRVDSAGLQLPYVDQLIFQVVDKKIIAAKTAFGESDIQARGLSFSDIPILKNGEETYGFKTLLWPKGYGNELVLLPNFNHNQAKWRTLIYKVDFRRALSLAIDRKRIQDAIYFGLGRISGNGVLTKSPLYDEKRHQQAILFDIEKANTLLDGLGLVKDKETGYRQFADGEKLTIIVETASSDQEKLKILDMIREDMKAIGIDIKIRTMPLETLRNRVFSGDTVMSVWSGVDNALANADIAPDEFAPVKQEWLQWPKWGQYHENKGQKGKEIDHPEVRELYELYQQWHTLATTEQRAVIWKKMLDIYSNTMMTIGIISEIPQPVVMHKKIQNIPNNSYFSWDPGAHFGIVYPDLWWIQGNE